MLGEDRGAEFNSHNIDAIAAEVDAELMKENRAAYRSFVEKERADHHAATEAARAQVSATADAFESRLVAVATKGHGRINQHFGHAEEFQVYEVSAAGAKFVGHRKVALYCQGGFDDDEALPGIVDALEGCDTVFVAKIGHCPKKDLAAAGIEVVETYAHDYIEASLIDWFAKTLAAQSALAA
jgi:nitrogen fixation protein NifB